MAPALLTFTEGLANGPLIGKGVVVSMKRLFLACGKVLATRAGAVLVKGGHGGGEDVVDLLLSGGSMRRFSHSRQHTTATHGTGCTLSSAIAAGLGAGRPLEIAVEEGIEYLQGAIAAAYPLGKGHGPVDHLYRGCADG